MDKKRAYLLSLFSGVLLGAAWNNYIPAVSLFVAFVPLLVVLKNNSWQYREVFLFSLLAFFVFHLGTVWWLANSSVWGAMVIMLLNSMIMALVVAWAFCIRQILGHAPGIVSLIVIWLAFEFLHYHWELSWPFMNLGNWLGQLPAWVQWYEYTGVLGGTLWILLVNVLLYFIFSSLFQNQKRNALMQGLVLIVVFVLPILISKAIYKRLDSGGSKKRFLIIQPNIDPYKEKYDTTLFKSQVNRQMELANSHKNGQYDCVIYPESSFPIYLDEDKLENDRFIKLVEEVIAKKNNTSVLGGFYSYRLDGKDTIYYNTAFFVEPGEKTRLYHKSKLVIGVEKMPFERYFSVLKSWNLNFGGNTNSLGIDNKRKVFKSGKRKLKIAPVICYESVYGRFVADFVRNDAEFIAIITNDAWWGDTPGYRQHLMHARLRAIENRRAVVRAANTGVTCFINPAGEITSHLKPWKEGTLNGSISSKSKLTFYAMKGDFIGVFAIGGALFLTILALIKNHKTKKQ